MKRIFIILLVSAVVFLACLPSQLPVPPPAFVAWCDACNEYTNWSVGESYFNCSESGTVWFFNEEASP